ncbi:MAG TPA: FAD-binding oxidoreductase, partial [Planctomycetota bacterium]|nr:FAD-binding oxidoreductase [Planctomycetota bacterium]
MPEAAASPRLSAPATAQALAAELAEAQAAGLRVLPAGLSRRRGPGAPPTRVDLVLSTHALRGLVAHEPGDLTVTVRTGTPLLELQTALARHRQVLPATDADGSLGGLLATAQDGPLDLLYGRLRERLLGITVALPDGSLASGRGRVVKNVAGYDLPRLLWGSLGTLGVIVEATLRVEPCPAARLRLTAHWADSGPAFVAARQVLDAPLQAAAADVLATGAGASLQVVLDGPPAGVAARAAALRDLLAPGEPADVELEEEDPVAIVRDPLQPGRRGAVVRVACEAAAQPALARALISGDRPPAVLARPGLELLFAAWAGSPPPEILQRDLALGRAAGAAVLWRAPRGLSTSVEMVWGPPPADLPLM